MAAFYFLCACVCMHVTGMCVYIVHTCMQIYNVHVQVLQTLKSSSDADTATANMLQVELMHMYHEMH